MYAFIFFKCPIRLIIGLYLVTPIRCEAGISVTPYQPISSSIFRAALSHQEIVPRVISFRQYNSFLSIQTNQANKTGLPHYPKLSSNPSHARNYRNTDNQDICYYSVGILQRRHSLTRKVKSRVINCTPLGLWPVFLEVTLCNCANRGKCYRQ